MRLQLQELWVDRNNLTGTLPSAWDQFTSVSTLCLLLQAPLYNVDAAGWLVHARLITKVTKALLCNVMALAVDHA